MHTPAHRTIDTTTPYMTIKCTQQAAIVSSSDELVRPPLFSMAPHPLSSSGPECLLHARSKQTDPTRSTAQQQRRLNSMAAEHAASNEQALTPSSNTYMDTPHTYCTNHGTIDESKQTNGSMQQPHAAAGCGALASHSPYAVIHKGRPTYSTRKTSRAKYKQKARKLQASHVGMDSVQQTGRSQS
jgi:hypothetical protein